MILSILGNPSLATHPKNHFAPSLRRLYIVELMSGAYSRVKYKFNSAIERLEILYGTLSPGKVKRVAKLFHIKYTVYSFKYADLWQRYLRLRHATTRLACNIGLLNGGPSLMGSLEYLWCLPGGRNNHVSSGDMVDKCLSTRKRVLRQC
jgi:hypothetical protein